MSTETFPSSGNGQTVLDKEGLPIPRKSSIKLDDEGLPIPESFKKKDASSNGLQHSQLGITKDQTAKGQQTTTSESGSPSDMTLHESIYGSKPKNQLQSFVEKPSFSDLTATLNKRGEELKTGIKPEEIERQKKEITDNYLNDSLTPQNIDYLKGQQDAGEFTSDQLATAINNKNRNIKNGSDNSIKSNVSNSAKKIRDIQGRIDAIKVNKQQTVFDYSTPLNTDKEVADLENQKSFLQASLTRAYEAEKKPVIENLKKDYFSKLGINSWADLYNTDDVNKQTGMLMPNATARVLNFADEQLNKAHNKTINAQSFGGEEKKVGNYPDIGRTLVNEINASILSEHEIKKFNDEFSKDKPNFKSFLEHRDNVDSYFNTTNVDSVKAATEIERNRNFLNIQSKYFGENGLANSNPAYVNIQHGYAEKVAKKLMPEDVAKKQMAQEIQNDKETKPLLDNYNKEIAQANDKARKSYETFIINGIKKSNPGSEIYPDGTVGIKGLTKEQSDKLLEDYAKQKDAHLQKAFTDQWLAVKKQSDIVARREGALEGSFGQTINDMLNAFHKWWFDKTGYGGDAMRWYQAQDISGGRIDLGDEAKTWEFHGANSLLDPNFYLSQAGKDIPLFAPSIAIGAVTGGEGIPEYLGWLASAGIFDFQNALPTYNSLVGSRDVNGNLISEYDAANAMSSQFKNSIVPDIAFMALQSGVLSRAKNVLIKPTIGKVALQTAKETAIGAIPMTWQGYASYSAALEAQGKEANLFDYLQSPEFRDNMISGMAGGLALNIAHLPRRYIKNINNWTQMVHSSEGEFYNNSLFHSALQTEANGNGERLRDQLKMHLLNIDPKHPGKGDIENTLLYSTFLKKNIDGGGIDTKDINGLFQAHNLALADLHKKWAEQNEGNKTISSIYASQSKDFEKEARNAMEDKAKFHYLVDNLGQPIFITDKGMQTLDKNGTIQDWFNRGIITDIRASDDENFGEKYRQQAKVGERGKMLAEGIDAIDKSYGKLSDIFGKAAKENPEQFLKDVAMQNYGITTDVQDENKLVRSNIPGAEQSTREQFGDKVVNAAKKLFPEESIISPQNKVNEETQTVADKGVKGQEKVIPEKEGNGKKENVTKPEGAEATQAAPSLSEVIGKPILYKGEKAIVYQDGQTLVAKIDGSNKEYELGNVDEMGGKQVSDFGIEQPHSVVSVDNEGNFTVREKKYTNPFEERGQNPLDAILYDRDGNIVNVRMKSDDGGRRTFTGDVAEDLAYQIHLKEITKDNETRESFEQFINDDAEAKKELENGGLSEVAAEKPVENNAAVPAKQEEVKTTAKEQPKVSEVKEAVTRIKIPPSNPPKTNDEVKLPAEEWSAIRKEKLKEIKGATDLFYNEERKQWRPIIESAMNNLQAMYPDKNLYDAAKSRINHFSTLYDNKTPFNPTTEDLAVAQYFKVETERRMSEIKGWDSPDDIQRTNAIAEFDNYNNDLLQVTKAINPREAGTAFGFRQSEARLDPEYGLQIRRMELLKAKGGEPLTNQDLEWTADHWEKEKELLQKEHELRAKGMQEDFDKQISKLQKEYNDKLKSVKPTGAKLTIEKQKNVADKLRKWADNFEKFGRADLPEGTQSAGVDVQKMIADAMRYVADKIEEGKLKIPDIIADAISKHANKDLRAEELKSEIQKQLSVAGLEKKDILNSKDFAFEKLKDNAEINNAKTITKDMVAKNLIRDFVNGHVGETEPTKILDEATKKLSEIFPFITKEQLTEAYLKTDDFKVPTGKELQSDYTTKKNKLVKISQIEKDISDLKNKQDIFVRDNKPSKAAALDKEIEAKESELKKQMIERGVKYSGEDKYTKATYNTRAQLHNERIEDLAKRISDRLEKGNLSDAEKSQLSKLKNQLDASKIKLDENSALSQKNTVENGLTQLSRVKRDFDKTVKSSDENLGTFKKQLQGIVDKFNLDKNETEQDAKLARAKDNLKNEVGELQRKINAGEFEEKQITSLNKSDAELIKLQIARDKLRGEYEKKRKDYEDKHKSALKKVAEFARAAEVAWLISSPVTLAKVGVSGLSRPTFEAATKLTGGKLYGVLPFETTKAIYKIAPRGGESTSWRSIKKGWEAQFKQFGEKKLEKLYNDANTKFEKSSAEYYKQKAIVDALDKNDANYEKENKKLQRLDNTRKSDMIDAVANSAYQFIGGSSIKDALDVLLHRTARIEEQFGNINKEGFNTKNKISVDNLDYIINFIGRAHAAEKNFSGRASFAGGFVSRLEGAVADGVDITKPEKILEVANDAFNDWNRGKYQEANWVSDRWNKVTNAIERESPELAYLMKADVAITRVPVNMIYEGVVEYSLGAIVGSYKSWQEYAKAKKSVLQLGITKENEEEFSSALRDELKKIPPQRAADILRAFRKGGFGLGFYALAAYGILGFGGFPHKGQTAEDKRKKAREEAGGEPELMTGELKIGTHEVPEAITKIFEHTPAFSPTFFSLGLKQVYDNNVIEGKTTAQAVTNSIVAHVQHIINSIPIIEKAVYPIASGALDNIGVSKFGQWTDIDENGQPVTRKPLRASDYLKYISGGKKGELSEKYYKDALATERYYNGQISDVMTNGTLTKEEKEKQRKELLDQKEKDIDNIYQQNKDNPE